MSNLTALKVDLADVLERHDPYDDPVMARVYMHDAATEIRQLRLDVAQQTVNAETIRSMQQELRNYEGEIARLQGLLAIRKADPCPYGQQGCPGGAACTCALPAPVSSKERVFKSGPIRAEFCDTCIIIDADSEEGDYAEVCLDMVEARDLRDWITSLLGAHETPAEPEDDPENAEIVAKLKAAFGGPPNERALSRAMCKLADGAINVDSGVAILTHAECDAIGKEIRRLNQAARERSPVKTGDES